ncbi:MAG: glycosyltransferase family 2 protein [Verrucomicrobia bacterium]|nr:glycosyltransferase family 2 protein [Verrucomicrobiota bacterium]
MTALVSILIPCYNAAAWVAATLESALAQTWPHTEIILVDDGSRDDSLAVARRFAARGVRIFPQANAGASAARNRALREARGDFIQFLDADDVLAPDKIARQLAALAPRSGCLACGPWGRFEADPALARFQPEENWRDAQPLEWLALNFAGRGMMPPAAWLVPRTLADAAGPWDERLTLNDDGEYFCRVLLRSRGIAFVADARTYYRSNLAGSLSRRRSDAAWQSAFLSHELCEKHVRAAEDSSRTRRACADLYVRLAHAMYPACPLLVAECEQRIGRLGGSPLRPGGGRAFRIASRCLGWKLARRLQLAFTSGASA